MQAVALEPPLTAASLVAALQARGVIGRGLPYANAVAFSPPLIISDGEVDELVRGHAGGARRRGRRGLSGPASRRLLDIFGFCERREAVILDVGLRDLLSAGGVCRGQHEHRERGRDHDQHGSDRERQVVAVCQ